MTTEGGGGDVPNLDAANLAESRIIGIEQLKETMAGPPAPARQVLQFVIENEGHLGLEFEDLEYPYILGFGFRVLVSCCVVVETKCMIST